MVLIVHGAGAKKELERVLSIELPEAASNEEDVVSWEDVKTPVLGELYSPRVFVIQSLAPPKWSDWYKWAPQHLVDTSKQVREFIGARQPNTCT